MTEPAGRHGRLAGIGPVAAMVPGNGSTYGRMREVWDLLDRPEVSLLCLEDHLLSITDDPAAYQLECWAVLAAMAERTSGPLISALVSPAALRNPAVTAKAAATVDAISAGRFVLGLGAGWYAKEFDFAGIPFPPLPERLDHVREVARRCREIWSDPGLQPMPGAPGIPILVGGKGLTTTLPVVARVADLWNTEGPPALWRERNEALDRECRAAGRPAGAILRTVALEPEEIDLLPEYRAAGAELAILVIRPSLRDDEITDIVHRARTSFGEIADSGAPDVGGSVASGQPDARRTDVRAYVVCAEPRSGSNLLCEALHATGAGGQPDEYLDGTYLRRHLADQGLTELARQPSRLTPEQWLTYLSALVRHTASGGVFGLKIHRHQYDLARRHGLPDLWDALADSCADVRAVLLTRRDTVRQAVSTFIAAQTGRYLCRPDEPPAERTPLPVAYWRGLDVPGPGLTDGRPVYDFEEIDRIVERIRADEQAWRAELKSRAIPHTAVTYEALTRRRKATIAEICRFLGLPEPAPFEPGFRQQSTRLNEEFAERYRRTVDARSR